ncbi:hypothetical protein [Leptospira bandrabouensis]|uniref:Uncharacterized protein n=1 Tax=Leptospira bandrabouensis TaxID=2484903 RepID=A0A6H3NL38_9LEPT|nr:hypothetical protein [Leptospira bandrabouensis]TGN11603.1 hypothetical protein EHR08_17065 [Leptospira bandrabouensis]
MEIIIKQISTKEEESNLIVAVNFLVEYYKEEIGDKMDFKLSLLSDENTKKYLVRNVSDDPNTYFCLMVKEGISYGFWLVDESSEMIGIEISISRQFENLAVAENNLNLFEQLIKIAK